MSNTVGLFIRTNPTLKIQAQAVASDLGFSLSDIINGYLQQLVKKKTIPFTIDDEEELELTPQAKRTLAKAKKDYEQGKGSPIFSTAEEMNKWLDAQDI